MQIFYMTLDITQNAALRMLKIMIKIGDFKSADKAMDQITFKKLHLWSQSQKRIPRFNPYPTAFPYGNGMVLHFYQQQESSTTKTVHKVINKGLKTYVHV